jgi:hypothetical protein
MTEQYSPSAAATAGCSVQPVNPTSKRFTAAANSHRICKGRENLNRDTASIPPRISLKAGCRKSPNTGKLHFTPIEKANTFRPTSSPSKHLKSAKVRHPANRVGALRGGAELLVCAAFSGPVGQALWPHRGLRDVAKAKQANATGCLVLHGAKYGPLAPVTALLGIPSPSLPMRKGLLDGDRRHILAWLRKRNFNSG